MVLVEAPIRSRSSHRPVQVPHLLGLTDLSPETQERGQAHPGSDPSRWGTRSSPDSRLRQVDLGGSHTPLK